MHAQVLAANALRSMGSPHEVLDTHKEHYNAPSAKIKLICVKAGGCNRAMCDSLSRGHQGGALRGVQCRLLTFARGRHWHWPSVPEFA